MPTDTILFPKSLTLDALADQITTYEAAMGPLATMGRTAEKTAATFKLGRKPDRDLRIATVAPPTATKVCEGKIWNAGVRVNAVAFRLPEE